VEVFQRRGSSAVLPDISFLSLLFGRHSVNKNHDSFRFISDNVAIRTERPNGENRALESVKKQQLLRSNDVQSLQGDCMHSVEFEIWDIECVFSNKIETQLGCPSQKCTPDHKSSVGMWSKDLEDRREGIQSSEAAWICNRGFDSVSDTQTQTPSFSALRRQQSKYQAQQSPPLNNWAGT
jgi:hypothetical protein